MNPLLTEMMGNLMVSMERDQLKQPDGFDCQILFLRMTFDTISRMTFGVDTGTQMNGMPSRKTFDCRNQHLAFKCDVFQLLNA